MTVVAEVAAFLAYRASRAGVPVDRRLVETAALLHDIDKALPPGHRLKALGHGAAGAAWVTEAGHPELARTLMAHPVTRFADDDVETWLDQAPLEERIVTYADKRATQRVVSLDRRFERWRCRHPEYADKLERALLVARRLERDVCTAAGIEPCEVERRRWVDDALERALARGVPDGRPAETIDGLPALPAPTGASDA